MSKRRRKLVVEEWLDMQLMGIEHLKTNGIALEDDCDVMEIVRLYRSMPGFDEDRANGATHEVTCAKKWADDGRQVYIFDRDFTNGIVNEKWADLLPDVITRRPFDSFYLKLPFNKMSEGVVVNVVPVNDVLNIPREEVMRCIVKGKGVHIVEQWNAPLVFDGRQVWAIMYFAIPNDFELMFDDTELGSYPPQLIINALAYLCSANADIEMVYSPKRNVRRKRDNLSMATWHDVGYRIGASIRRFEKEARENRPHQGGTVRPHMRRAHFHHYWVGSKNDPDERRLELRWVPPVMVNADKGEITSATGHKVVGGGRC